MGVLETENSGWDYNFLAQILVGFTVLWDSTLSNTHAYTHIHTTSLSLSLSHTHTYRKLTNTYFTH